MLPQRTMQVATVALMRTQPRQLSKAAEPPPAAAAAKPATQRRLTDPAPLQLRGNRPMDPPSVLTKAEAADRRGKVATKKTPGGDLPRGQAAGGLAPLPGVGVGGGGGGVSKAGGRP